MNYGHLVVQRPQAEPNTEEDGAGESVDEYGLSRTWEGGEEGEEGGREVSQLQQQQDMSIG